ncbi:hypothetical protein K8R47_03115 [archaeon]|nr:hypothetical protein [archaeon]
MVKDLIEKLRGKRISIDSEQFFAGEFHDITEKGLVGEVYEHCFELKLSSSCAILVPFFAPEIYKILRIKDNEENVVYKY